MAKRDFSVTRWVLINEAGYYATDEAQGYFSKDLEDAHIFVGRPKRTLAVSPVEVTVTLSRHQRG